MSSIAWLVLLICLLKQRKKAKDQLWTLMGVHKEEIRKAVQPDRDEAEMMHNKLVRSQRIPKILQSALHSAGRVKVLSLQSVVSSGCVMVHFSRILAKWS